MSNQFGAWRLRILDDNGEPFAQEARIRFFDTDLTTPKDVYADPDLTTSLGSIVSLDSAGYVDVSGLWPSTGNYSATVQTLVGYDDFNAEVWQDEYTSPILEGDTEIDITSDIIVYPSVTAMQSSSTYGNSFCMGYYTAGDGGGGMFDWIATSVLSEDGGSVVKATGEDVGRYIRQFNGIKATIQLWGANVDVENNKVFLVRAMDWALANETPVFFTSGSYNIQSEDITINRFVVYEKDCVIDTAGGDVVYDNCTIESRVQLTTSSSVNVTIIGQEGVIPQWVGATADGVENDAPFFLPAIQVANNSSLPLVLDGDYLLDSVLAISTISRTIVKENAIIDLGTIAVFDVGELVVPANYKNFLKGSMSAFVPNEQEYRSSWFDSFTASKLSDIFSESTYKATWIHDVDINFSSEYIEEAEINHIFDGAQWTISEDTDDVSFVRTNFLSSNFSDGLDSISNISQDKLVIDYDSNDSTLSTTSSLSFRSGEVTFNECSISIDAAAVTFSDVTFNGCTCLFGQAITITYSTGTLINSTFIGGDGLYASVGETKTDGSDFTHEATFSGNYINLHNSKFSSLGLSGNVIGELKTMWVTNNRITGIITLISNETDTIVSQLRIQNNNFIQELATTRILHTGSFINDGVSHDFIISDNRAETGDEQSYVPMTKGEYLVRNNTIGAGGTLYLINPADENVYDIDLIVYDDVKWSSSAILSRQVFSLNDASDVTLFDIYKLTNARCNCYNGSVFAYAYDLPCFLKGSDVGTLLTDNRFYFIRGAHSDTTTLPFATDVRFTAVLQFSLYDSSMFDYSWTAHLLP